MKKILILFILTLLISGCNNKIDIYSAIEKNDLKSVKKTALKNRKILSIQDKNKDYPVFYAIQLKSIEIIKYLITFEVNYKLKSLDDLNMLNYADTFGNFETVKLLIDSGMNPDTLDNAKKTLLMYAPFGNRTELAEYLILKGADVNYQDPVYGQTALILCGFYGSYDTALVLLKNGADKNVKNKEGFTAEEYAVKFGHDNAAKLIREYK